MAIFVPKSKNQVEILIDLILHEGLLTYKPKASDAPVELQRRAKQFDKIHKKGAVFAVRQKSDFGKGVKGYIVTSKETLVKQAEMISHFTPNVYRNYEYANTKRTYIKGFEESNLQQINTFVIDIDTKKYSVNEILLACIDESIGEPTAILETDKGYQVYFVLAEPIFISNQKRFLSLHVAKRIAENLKHSLSCVEADQYCNDFGFFRMPNSCNIVWFNEYLTYQPKQLIDWSQRKDDDRNRKLYVVNTQRQSSSMLKSDWMHLLLTTKDVKGEKSRIGRNNLIFTIALSCLKDGQTEAYAYDLLDQFNSKLLYPLPQHEINAIIKSAYSGRYFGPKKEYVEQLIELYVPGANDLQLSFGQPTWYKHKKARVDRERSHLYEWEEDISNWISAQKSEWEPFIWRTQKELCAAVGISNSSLNKLLKQSKTLLKTTTGKGRYAKTGWTTVDLYIKYILWLKKDTAERHAETIHLMIDEDLANLAKIAGYNRIAVYVQNLKKERIHYEQMTLTGVG